MITACYRYRVQGNGIGIGIGNGDIQCARQVLELKGIVVCGVGGHGEFQDLLAGAIGTIMVIGWECNGRGVGAPVGYLERGGIKGIVGGVAQAGVADVGMSLDALHGMGVAVEADGVAVHPGGIGAVEEDLGAAGHRLGKNLHHAIVVFELLATCYGQHGKKQCQQRIYFPHG